MEAFKVVGKIASTFNGKKVQKGSNLNQYLPLADFQNLVNSKVTHKLTGTDSIFGGAGNWVTALGSLVPDVNTYPGYLYLNFGSGRNQCIKIDNKVEVGATKTYLFSIKIKIQSGSGTIFDVGAFPAIDLGTYSMQITPTSEFRWFHALFSGFKQTTFYMGVLAANNNGTDFLIDEIKIDEVNLADLYDLDISKQAISDSSAFMANVSKADNTLLELNMMGDSILANPMGTIPVANDEGETMRPVRLVSNNVVRHLYDKIKYNVPIFRRLDHAGWTKSGSDFVWEYFTNSGESELIHRTVVPDSYCEFTVPDGVSNFAIMYRHGYIASPGYDSNIAVTINGGDISAYGSASFSTDTANLFSNNNIAIQKYTGLPSGDNVIRFTKSNDVKYFEIWGGAYWNGNTMILKNYAQGGWAIGNVSAIVRYHTVNFNLKNWIVEFPNMNNCGKSITAITQVTELMMSFRNNKFEKENICFVTTHPFGVDPYDGNPNYYTTYNNPLTFKQRSTLDICIAVYFGLQYVDLFRMFEKKILARGGTLLTGESGGYYTHDGQHLDEEGVEIFSNYLLPKLPVIPD